MHLFLNVILGNHSRISIVYCRTVAYLHFYRICILLKTTTIVSTENLPPVATARSAPTATGGTILNVPAEAAVFDQEFLDNYDLDAEGGDDYTLSQKMVHYCGGNITQTHWIACKACLAFFAGASTSKMLTTTKTLKEALCLQIYLNAIAALNNMHFDAGAKAFFRHSLQKKDDPMNAVSVYRYYQDTRLRIHNHVMPFFPKDMGYNDEWAWVS